MINFGLLGATPYWLCILLTRRYYWFTYTKIHKHNFYKTLWNITEF